MKGANKFIFALISLGIIMLVLPLAPASVQPTKGVSWKDAAWRNATRDPVLHCPAGVKPTCAPRRFGGVVVCKQGDEIKGYNSISDYCLSCHATSQPMVFEHPLEIKYPKSRAEFRERSSLHESIALDAGDLTCRTCHSGANAKNHFLVAHYGYDRICGHCHVTEIECPGKNADLQSVCFPGRLNDGVRCVLGKDILLYANTSEFCVDCHGGNIQSMSRFHPVEIKYPLNRRGFTPIAELDPRIKLEDGHITCESCHEKMDEGFSLCIHCHPK